MTKRNEQVEDATISFGCNEGDKLFRHILEEYPVLDSNDLRRETIIFSLFTSAIQYLHIKDWSEQQLVHEVFEHCEQARKWLDDDDSDE
jgi:hypothetical protein